MQQKAIEVKFGVEFFYQSNRDALYLYRETVHYSLVISALRDTVSPARTSLSSKPAVAALWLDETDTRSLHRPCMLPAHTSLGLSAAQEHCLRLLRYRHLVSESFGVDN